MFSSEADRTNEFRSGWKDEWVSILKVSTLWHFLGLRKMAIQALETGSFSFGIFSPNSTTGALLIATEKIILGRKYSISSWVEAGYTELAINGNISNTEMREIGSEVSFQLMRISLGLQKKSMPHSRLEETVKETFREELQSIAAAEEAFLDPPQMPEEELQAFDKETFGSTWGFSGTYTTFGTPQPEETIDWQPRFGA